MRNIQGAFESLIRTCELACQMGVGSGLSIWSTLLDAPRLMPSTSSK